MAAPQSVSAQLASRLHVHDTPASAVQSETKTYSALFGLGLNRQVLIKDTVTCRSRLVPLSHPRAQTVHPAPRLDVNASVWARLQVDLQHRLQPHPAGSSFLCGADRSCSTGAIDAAAAFAIHRVRNIDGGGSSATSRNLAAAGAFARRRRLSMTRAVEHAGAAGARGTAADGEHDWLVHGDGSGVQAGLQAGQPTLSHLHWGQYIRLRLPSIEANDFKHAG